MIPYAALLATIIPAVTGVLIYLTRKRLKEGLGWLATAATSISFLLILSMVPQLMENHQTGQGPLVFTYSWIDPISVNFGFLVDMVSLPIALVVAFVSVVSCLYSIKYMEGKPSQAIYYACVLLSATGMIGVILSEDLIQLYLFWELMLIPLYFLIAFWGESSKRVNIGFKYFIFSHVGALSMLLGILLIYVYAETFELMLLPEQSYLIPSSILPIIMTLLLFGFFVKMAVFPVHVWLPDAHSEAPTPVSAMLSGLVIKCGAYGIVRIIFLTFGQTVLQTSDFLAIPGIITMVYGGVMALAQTDMKRLLAFSSISQIGYILFGFGTTSTLGIKGGLLHIISHAICKSLLFMCAGSIARQTGTRDIRKLGGLIQKMPTTTIACFIGALSLVGIPPLNGFWSEWMIFGGGISSGKILITFVGVASTMITAGYYLRFLWSISFGPLPRNLSNVKQAPLLLRIPTLILAATAILLGILPGLALEFMTPAAEYLSSLIDGGP